MSLSLILFVQGQIKLKEAALETSTASFMEKEKDLQNVIEELEKRVEEINQNSAFEQVSNPLYYVMHSNQCLC